MLFNMAIYIANEVIRTDGSEAEFEAIGIHFPPNTYPHSHVTNCHPCFTTHLY